MLNSKDDAEMDVMKRIVDCTITIKRLHIFFYGSDCSTRRKLQVYSAVIRSKLMYGLETAMMNKSVLSRLDAFQMKGLRKIMKMQHTYYNRAHTNQYVLDCAAAELGSLDDPLIQPLSQYHRQQRLKLLAKLITLRHKDPAAKASFDPETLQPYHYGKKRVGRPRLNWVECTMEDFWAEAKTLIPQASGQGVLNLNFDLHRDAILALAEVYYQKYCFGNGSR